MCGECTGEVTPVTRTLGQMAVAAQAPAVEPVMMVIESSPFPEPVADAPGAHPPAVVPPEPVPLAAHAHSRQATLPLYHALTPRHAGQSSRSPFRLAV